jgi:hypothetical protein
VRVIRKSSYEQYKAWYLEREKAKGNNQDVKPLYGDADYALVELTEEEIYALLRYRNGTPDRLGLLWLDHNPRTLGATARRAIETGYFDEFSAGKPFHRYYQRLLDGDLKFQGIDKICLRLLNSDERKEMAGIDCFFCIHDGWGRLLPYAALLLSRKLSCMPVQAFLCFSERNH